MWKIREFKFNPSQGATPMTILDFVPDLAPRESFVGTLQLYWDSTSLNAIKTCPYKYYLSIICGVIPLTESVHLKFGILYHEGHEFFARRLAEGLSREEAIEETILHIMKKTWEPRMNRGWVSGHETKNRFTLIRTLLDHFDFYKNDENIFSQVLLPDGKPAVELSFKFDLSYETPSGIPYKLCGHIDSLKEKSQRLYPRDFKTSGMSLSSSYWSQYDPNNQISTYYFAGQVIFDRKISGILIDAVQITPNGSIFERREFNRTPAQIDEWYKDLGFWIAFAETCSRQNYWPKNETACQKGFMTCEYITICKNCPNARDTWMKSGWGKRIWDPAVARGE